MNAMQILAGPLAQAIGWALLHLLWQGTIVAGILAAVLALLSRRSANARYVASCSALALVFAMFVATVVRSYDGTAKPVAPSPTAQSEMISLQRVPVIIVADATITWRERVDALASSARSSLPLVVAFWLAGVVLLSSRLLVSWVRARRLATRGTQEASVHWQAIAARLSDALGLRRAIRLLESSAVEVPSVLGSIRPVILLPASALTGLTPEQLEMVLAHELAHIRRHDFFVNLLQAFVETLMFYHPAIWWMSRRVRIERENCCDDLAVAVCGDALQYARALTRLEELRAAAPDVAVAANGGSLLDRIRRIVGGRAESIGLSSRWAAAVAMLSLVAIAIALPSVPALAEKQADQEKAARKAEATIEVAAARGVKDGVPEGVADALADGVADGTADGILDVVDPDIDLDIDVDTPDVDPDLDIDMDLDTDTDMETPVAPRAPRAHPVSPTPAVAPAPRAAIMAGHPAPAVAPAPPAPMALAMAMDEDAKDKSWKDRKFSEGGKLTVDELINLAAVGVTPQYIEQMRAMFPDLTVRQVVSAKAVDLTPQYIRDVRAANLSVTTIREATSLMAVGVTPEYLREMRGAGVDLKTSKEAQQLAAMGVTAKFVRQLADAGYANLSVKELTRLAAAGVDGDFIRDMQKYRDK